MKLKEIYSQNDVAENFFNCDFFAQKKPIITFEVYPPKDDFDNSKLNKLICHLEKLKKFNPAFVSLTYGAGGSTQNSSIEIINRIQNELSINVMPHFTCVGTSKSDVENYLKEIFQFGIENILALRGDLPEGYSKNQGDFSYASELVEFVKSRNQLSIGVAGYPEGHIDCQNLQTDIQYLKKKVDLGADAIYTQMFFDNDKFFSFVQLARDAGISVPIIPGILPIMNYAQLDKMLSMARVTLPSALLNRLEKFKDSPDDIKKLGVEFASYQCQQLIDAEVSGLHFFTLNTSASVLQILENLGC